MVETGDNDGPATHAVIFVWNGHEVTNNILMDGSQELKILPFLVFLPLPGS